MSIKNKLATFTSVTGVICATNYSNTKSIKAVKLSNKEKLISEKYTLLEKGANHKWFEILSNYQKIIQTRHSIWQF